MKTKNEQAFLDTIAWAELGDALLKESENGYDVIVGSTPTNMFLLLDYSDHPRVKMMKLNSTAAGRYQIKKNIYDYYKKFLNLLDFSPESQDKIALQLIKECKALDDINSGRFKIAANKVKSRWASFPGAGYGQREHKMEDLIKVFVKNGGTLSES